MNITQQTIEELKTKIAELEAEMAKPKKFEFKWTNNSLYCLFDTYIDKGYSGTNRILLEHGRYRRTEGGAELSLARNKRANRLEMLVEYLGGLVEFQLGGDNYYIYYVDETWHYSGVIESYYPETIYMTKEVAVKVCEMLNSGEYEL